MNKLITDYLKWIHEDYGHGGFSLLEDKDDYGMKSIDAEFNFTAEKSVICIHINVEDGCLEVTGELPSVINGKKIEQASSFVTNLNQQRKAKEEDGHFLILRYDIFGAEENCAHNSFLAFQIKRQLDEEDTELCIRHAVFSVATALDCSHDELVALLLHN